MNATPYQVVPSNVLMHVASGQRFSPFTSFPPIPGTVAEDYDRVQVGWTVYNPLTGQYGIGRAPWPTKADAEAWAAGKVCSAIGIGD